MKKIIILLITLLILTSCQKQEQAPKTLKEIYPEIEDELRLVETEPNDIMAMLKNGTGIIFLSWQDCPWCHYYINYVNKMANNNDIEVLYYDIYDDRDNNTEFYQQVCQQIAPYIDTYAYSTLDKVKKAYDSSGKVRIYVPMLIFVSQGQIIGMDYQGSMEEDFDNNHETFWNEINADGISRIDQLNSTINQWASTIKKLKDEIDNSGCNEACEIEEE